MQRKSCIMCGNSMMDGFGAYVCLECEQHSPEARSLNHWDI